MHPSQINEIFPAGAPLAAVFAAVAPGKKLRRGRRAAQVRLSLPKSVNQRAHRPRRLVTSPPGDSGGSATIVPGIQKRASTLCGTALFEPIQGGFRLRALALARVHLAVEAGSAYYLNLPRCLFSAFFARFCCAKNLHKKPLLAVMIRFYK